MPSHMGKTHDTDSSSPIGVVVKTPIFKQTDLAVLTTDRHVSRHSNQKTKQTEVQQNTLQNRVARRSILRSVA